MIKLLLLSILPFTLFASKILSYNIYDRTDRVDVMITFDTPYEGTIKKSISNSQIIIKLQNATIESSKIKNLKSQFIHTLSITPMSTYVQITASIPSDIKLVASKTSDAYGLRLRFIKNTPSNKNKLLPQSTQLRTPSPISLLPTKKDDNLSQSYYIVIVILIVGIFILYFIKTKVTPKKYNNKTNNWLFDKNKKIQDPTNRSQNDVTIRFQKSLDEKNSVVMLDFSGQSYLVMMGTTNLLLDRFTDNKPSSQKDFEAILQDKHQALEEFLDESKKQDSMQSYVNKASSISYEV